MSRLRGLLRDRSDDSAPREQPRRLRHRDQEEPLRVAVMTFVRDEGTMLPRWVQYYGAQVGVENLYVIDDSSVDGSTDDLPCDVIRIPAVRGGKFESTRMGFLDGLGRALRELYDCVIFCDADEFIVPDPARHGSLLEFIATREREGELPGALGVLGLNVVHAVDSEPALDLSQPVLGQRQLAKFLPLMCKPSLNFVAAPWYIASHGIRTPYRVDPDLWMFHLKFADRDLLRAVADQRRSVVEADGRSKNTSWRRGGDELVGLLEEVAAGVSRPEDHREFVVPEGQNLLDLVVEDPPDGWRSRKGSQIELMRKRPLVRVPQRFHGLV
jgi:hypothetical protein